MADVKWIKICTDIFDDEKMLLIESMPEADSIIVIWFKLLVKARLKNAEGLLEFCVNPRIILTDETLKTVLRYKGDNIGEIMRILEKQGFIQRKPNKIFVIPFWQDRHDRNSMRYRKWRDKVFTRDKYTCQGCGTHKDLQAHHIIHWSDCENEDLRYSVENGITLCRACHLEAHGGSWRK